ncbi:MAG: type I restriction enzyme HsdR N-terminal domain-containing protein [Bacteroidia bacterium]|nr:type I restriction enzyme HsdR N-terminal domain-containing protein [Bacteroidia bacterium]
MKKNEENQYWDKFRKKYVTLTQEEIVRQLVLTWLEAGGYNPQWIALEKEFTVQQKKKRFDICVFRQSGQPFLLIECKANTIFLTSKHYYQLLSYQSEIQAEWIAITNGSQVYAIRRDGTFKENYIPSKPEDE